MVPGVPGHAKERPELDNFARDKDLIWLAAAEEAGLGQLPVWEKRALIAAEVRFEGRDHAAGCGDGY